MEKNKINNREKHSLNFIIIGKSGVGKSSFLNYLIGENHFVTGDGSPVTQDYFTHASFIKDGIEYNLYDTKGIEPDTTNECKKIVQDKIDEKDRSENIYDWIHTIYYCFAASSKRIESFEISFIKEIHKKANIIVLLTKKDFVSEADLGKLANQIHSEIGNTIPVITVCSVEERTRKGISIPEGKEMVLRASFYGLWNKLSKKLPSDVIAPLNTTLESFTTKFNWIDFKNFQQNDRIFSFTKLIDIILFEHAPYLFRSFQTEINLNLSYLSDLPQDIIIDDKDARKEFILFVEGVKKSCDKLKMICKKMKDTNLMDLYKKNCQDVLNFYKILNHCSPPSLNTQQTETAYNELIDSDFHSKSTGAIFNLYLKLTKAIKEVENCYLFDGDEKEKVKELYYKFRNEVQTYINNLNKYINNFTKVSETELLQYGHYCIRDSNVEIRIEKTIDTKDDLNKYEKIFLDIAKVLFSDGKISPKEQEVLELYRSNFGISLYRAQEILRLFPSTPNADTE